MGIRFGTASSEARIAPVEYSLLITITPSTQMASWPRPNPAPNSTAVGSVEQPDVVGVVARAVPGVGDDDAISALKPMATTMNASSDHSVDLTERIFVHSAASSPGVIAASTRRTRRCQRSAP